MRTLSPTLLRCLATPVDNRTDGDLLNGFLTHHEEADFTELVKRYGPMVWGTCRRSLPDHADAEDAFQTVFLVLVQRGKRLIHCPSIGPWLHRVAIWTARNVRRRNARRLASRVAVPEHLPSSHRDVDLSLDLDAALLSLPEKLRASILLCHIIGLSRREAANHLGCAERTLSLWLARGLARLRNKLRGLDPAKTLGIAALTVPVGLGDSVVRAALSMQAAAVAASVLPPTISNLVEGVIRMFWVKKATAASVALFAMFALGVGIGVSTKQLAPAVGGEEKIAVAQQANTATGKQDLDVEIAELEKQMVEAKRILDLAVVGIDLSDAKVQLGERAGIDSKDLQADRDTLTQFKEAAEARKKKLEKLRKELITLRQLKALQALSAILKSQEVEIDEEKINEMTLRDLLNQLGKKYGILFQVNEGAFTVEMANEGTIKVEMTTNILDQKPKLPKLMIVKGRKVRLDAFLDLVLTSMNATYIVRPDYIEITTFAKRLEEKVTRVFPTSDLVLPNRDEKTTEAPKRANAANLKLLEKQLQDAQLLLEKQQTEMEATRAEYLALKAAVAKLRADEGKAKEKAVPSAKIESSYLELKLDGTMGLKSLDEKIPLPFHVNEVGPDGKAIGSVYFTNADVLGRYLARTLKDSNGPKELRIVSRADTANEQLKQVMDVSKAAGFKDIVISKIGVEDKLANGDEEKKRAEREQFELQKEAIRRELLNQRERKSLLDAQKALEERAAELQKLLEQKEAEIRKLKEGN